MSVTPPRGWNETLRDQLDVHYRQLFRARVEGLTDEEYLWEPAPGSWSIRPRGTSSAPGPIGSGDLRRDDAPDELDPAPVTTIAWRIAHVTVECLSTRTMNHFDGPSAHWESWEYTDRAERALAQLDTAYDAWVAGVAGLGEEGLVRPIGPAEGPWAESPYADLVLHINRELIHHGAEICLLRDLYRVRAASGNLQESR
jgi:DinB superfamily